MKYFRTYHWYILKFHFKWAWDTKQLSYAKGILKAVIWSKKYDIWWKYETCRAYRKIKQDGLAFCDNFIGLPSQYTEI